MKFKFVVLSALVGATGAFGLNPALSAPAVSEPTNLQALFKAREQGKTADAGKDAGRAVRKTQAAKSEAGKTEAGKTEAGRKHTSKVTAKAGKARSAKSRTKVRAAREKATVQKVSIVVRQPSPAAVTAASKGGSSYTQIINRYASSYGVPSSLAHAVVRHESNFKPDVRGKAGEIGLMQIKLSTARAMGYSGSAKDLYEPATNIQYGMKYLAMAQKLGGGSTCGTILKYNAGHGAKRMNPISAKYCSSVQAYMRSF